MSKKTLDTETISTEQAIAMALSAERESFQSIAESQADAEHILEQARQMAHDISQRADQRIAFIHQRCKQLAADEINRWQRSTEEKMNNAQALDKEAVDHAIKRLAESLTITGSQSGNTGS